MLGKTNRDISGSNELWDFFKNYSRCSTANVKSIQKSALTIAPNPAMHFLRISVDHQTPEEIEVFNHHGQIILKVFKIEALNVQSLPVGWYYVKARYQHQFFGAPFIKMDN